MKILRGACVPVFSLLIAIIVGCTRNTTDPSPSQIATIPTPSAGTALTITNIDSPAGPDSREPELYSSPDGRAILSWVEKTGDNHYALMSATRDASGWSESRKVAEGNNWFINWADFPSVISLAEGAQAAHWLVKSGSGTYAYDVNIALSKDDGKTWSRPIVPHTDKTQTEHGFVSLFPLSDGQLGAVWLDGRNFKGMKEEDGHGPSPVSMTLRYAAIDAQGKLSDEALLDERVCECCQTSAAVTADGPIVVYRDRSEHEVRDIYFVRSQGGAWSAPQPVHPDGWEINGCPVNGPSVAADGRRVAVAWYTEANRQPRVRVAFSADAGKSFGNPIQIDDGNPVGRVDVLLLTDGSALVCWLSGTPERGEIKVRRAVSDGTLGTVSTIAETDIARSSGFPRMARLGDEIFFAWTEFGKPSRVRTAKASVSIDR